MRSKPIQYTILLQICSTRNQCEATGLAEAD